MQIVAFTAPGTGPEFILKPGDPLTYFAAGTFTGSIALQQSIDRVWTTIETLTTEGVGSLKFAESDDGDAHYRMKALTLSAGQANVGFGKDLSNRPQFRVAEMSFTETAGAGVYTCCVVLPAQAMLHDILVSAIALWNPATSATLKVGDGADDDGYYTAVDMMATDLLAGESISFAFNGGKAGIYIVSTRVSPRFSLTARVLTATITVVGGSGSTGRTRVQCLFSIPSVDDVIPAVKV